MSADLNTEITLRGNKEELLAMLKVLRGFATDSLEQYQNHRDCAYLEDVEASSEADTCDLADATDDELVEFLAEAGNELEINSAGPWGAFFDPSDIGLFESLAESAPNAYFTGLIEGFVTGADVSHTAELNAGILSLTSSMVCDDDVPNLYAKYFKKKLPYAKFCKLFKVDKEDFDIDCYDEFIEQVGYDGFPEDVDAFLDFCGSSEIDEDKYDSVIEKIEELDILSFDDFRDEIPMEDFAEKRYYNPVTKKYSKTLGGTKCDGLTFVITGKTTSFKNRDAFTEYVEAQGGKVTGSISKNTNYLVNNDATSTSSKNKKAMELGIPIITEAEFIEKFGC